MMKLSVAAGSTSQSINVFIRDSASTTGGGKTGLAFNTSGLTAYYTFAGANAASVAISLATLAAANSAWSSGGFKEIDAINMPGWYRFDPPNAALTTSKGRCVSIHLQGAAGMAPCPVEIELTGWNNQDAVRGGMTALPNAVAGASAGLIINGSNSGTVTLAGLTVSGATTLTGAVSLAAGLAITQSTTDADAVTITGNGAGAGLTVTGGGTGRGATIAGGATSGAGLTITATTNAGVQINGGTSGMSISSSNGTNGTGLLLAGRGVSPGLGVTGGSNGATGATFAGGNASGSTPAGCGAKFTGGTASTTSGGVAGVGVAVFGGAGAGSTNGAAAGATFTGGGTNAVSSAADGVVMTGTSAGTGLNATLGDSRIANLDAAISTRLASANYTAPDNASISAVKAVTDHLATALELNGGNYRFTVAALANAPTGGATAADIADKLLGRSVEGGADGGNTVSQAYQKMRNKTDTTTTANHLTVFQSDGTTISYTQPLVVDAAAELIVSVG